VDGLAREAASRLDREMPPDRGWGTSPDRDRPGEPQFYRDNHSHPCEPGAFAPPFRDV